MDYNVLRRRDFAGGLTDEALKIRIQDDLARDGWTLLRGFQPDMAGFAGLVGRLCRRVTFDPARSHSTDKTQMVDAGLGPIGLHIENGNTPRCPDIVTFFAERAAFEGSQTTICDGMAVWDAFDAARKARWSQKMTVERDLPELIWKSELTPDVLSVLMVVPERMSVETLYSYIRHLEENNQRTSRYEIALWKKLAYPFAARVMMGLALPFGYMQTRMGGVSLKVFSGIMIGVGFHLLNGLFSNLGVINGWIPAVAALTPSIGFLLAAMGMMWWVERR